jgi:hypothetical protein
MGKRLADYATRRFFDEFASVRVSRFRALGIIDPQKQQAAIPFPDGSTKLLAVAHVRFWNGGGWSYFLCPKCSRRTPKLYLVDERPLCTRCCAALNIHHTSRMGIGREARRKAQDRRLDELIAKLETKEPLRLKPAPAIWGQQAARVYGSRSLRASIRRRLITLRLHALAYQEGKTLEPAGFTPVPEAKQLLDIRPIWEANTPETLSQALDHAQTIILAALESDDPQQRLNAAKLMMRTKQARDRGL